MRSLSDYNSPTGKQAHRTKSTLSRGQMSLTIISCRCAMNPAITDTVFSDQPAFGKEKKYFVVIVLMARCSLRRRLSSGTFTLKLVRQHSVF